MSIDDLPNAADLLDFDTTTLYYERPLPQEVEVLIEKASSNNSDALAEAYLKLACFQAPRNLTVLVALYRFYYYKHRLQEALDIAEQAVAATANLLELPADWRDVSAETFRKKCASKVMGLVRFYLSSVKGAAVLCLRLGRMDEAVERLRKLTNLDARDRLASRELLQLALRRIENDTREAHFQTH